MLRVTAVVPAIRRLGGLKLAPLAERRLLAVRMPTEAGLRKGWVILGWLLRLLVIGPAASFIVMLLGTAPLALRIGPGRLRAALLSVGAGSGPARLRTGKCVLRGHRGNPLKVGRKLWLRLIVDSRL